MSKQEYRRLAKDAVFFAIGNMGSKILSFLFVPFYTAYLTTAEFGIADIITTTVTLIFPILTIGISEAVLRYACDETENKKEVFSVSVAVIVAATVINTSLAYIVASFFPSISEYILYYVVLFFLSALELSLSNYIKGFGYTRLFAIKGIVYTAVFIFSNIIFLTVLNKSLSGYVYSMIIANIVSILTMIMGGRLENFAVSFRINKKLAKSMFRYSLPMVPATIAWWLNISLNRYMIAYMVGVDETGLYSIATKIPTIVASITAIFSQAWQLAAMRSYGSKDFSVFFSNIFQLIHYILIVGAIIAITGNKILAYFLFRNDFFLAWRYVPLLLISAILSSEAGVLASAYTSAKKTNILFISTVTAAVINVIINYALIKAMGAIGATLATVISFSCMIYVRVLLMKSIVLLSVNWKLYISTLFIMTVSSIFAIYSDSNYYEIVLFMDIVVLLINLRNASNILRKIISLAH